MSFFPRGNGPLVSIILPSRGRPAGLCQSLDSLNSLAKDPSQIEYILKIDSDDQETINVYEKLKGMINIRAWISPRGLGYMDMHKWVNELALNWATGDWCMLWNDDAVLSSGNGADILDSQGWDIRLTLANFQAGATWHACPDICSLIAPTVGRWDASEFYFLRRKVVEILGHWALNPHTDTYIQSVLCSISSSFRFPVYVSHKSDHINDVVRGEVLDAYKVAGKNLNSLECMRNKVEDTRKLIDYVEKWRRERCGECKTFLTTSPRFVSSDESYLLVNSDCSHGNYILCKKCYSDNKLGACPECGIKAVSSKKENKNEVTVSF